jgi:beta-glucosidase
VSVIPNGFRWGVATASYQIEGAVKEDGRGPSIWDTFSHEPDRIADGGTGDVACDHYHRFGEDIALMADLGLNAYRFSLSWSRIQPTGAGPANAAGLDFYDRLVDALLARDIDPYVTLFHWDLPQTLQDQGGWLNRDTALRFADYAGVAAARLGDRVAAWTTLNEPSIHTTYGHIFGLHAPGAELSDDPFPVVHHQLLAHGLATSALHAARSGAATAGKVGMANNYAPAWAVGTDGHRESATEADHAAVEVFDTFHNRLFTDPLLLGRYPDGLDGFAAAGRLQDPDLVRDGDLAAIAAPIDLLGVNFYSLTAIGESRSPGPFPYELRQLDEGHPTTYFGWPVVPDALRDMLVDLRERYGDALPEIAITENGCAYEDVPGPDGSVNDTERIAYHAAHLGALEQAIAAGITITGYFAWSLMDNFEWAEGYSKRFGLVHVDFATQQRTPKASYHWYADRIRQSR